MTIKITTPNGGSDSLDFGCARTAIAATVTGTEVSSGEGKLELKTTTGGTSATKATVLANGNVGIGIAAPTSELQVTAATPEVNIHDGAADTFTSGNVSSSLLFTARNSSVRTMGEIDAIHASTNGTIGHLRFQTRHGDALAERMRIASDGNVGIGTSTPTNAKLEVTHSSATVPAGHFRNTSGSGDSPALIVQGGANNAGGNLQVKDYAGNVDFQVGGDGSVGIGTELPSTGYGGAIANVKLALRGAGAGGNNGTATLLIGGDNNHYSYVSSEHTGGGKTYLSFGTASDAINPTEKLRITDDGRGLSQFTAKAWVNFNGRGTLAVRDSHNVSSVADNGGGMYTINFTNAMANTNYSVVGSAGNSNSGAGHRIFMTGITLGGFAPAFATGSVRVCTPASDHTPYDADYIHAVVFGD